MRAPAKTFVAARRLRKAMSLPEVRLWQALRALDRMLAPRVRRQHPIGPFVLDFFVPSARLAIEIDGATHDNVVRYTRDRARDAWLAARGIRVLRFLATDVLDTRRRDGVIETILAAVTRNDAARILLRAAGRGTMRSMVEGAGALP